MITVADIEPKRYANPRFLVGAQSLAHVALVLSGAAARIVMQTRGDTGFDHA